MPKIEQEFLDAFAEQGIVFQSVAGRTNATATWESIRETEKEPVFSTVFCRYVDSKEWKQEGGPSFFSTQLWKRVRYLAITQNGNRCQCCGASPQTGAVIHVDHIKPRSKHPELALTLSNLQVLCEACNVGKSNVDETDWRGKPISG